MIYTNYTNKQDKKLDEKKIEQLWNTYTNSLVNQSNFLNCFKYFYHMVNTVIDYEFRCNNNIQET